MSTLDDKFDCIQAFLTIERGFFSEDSQHNTYKAAMRTVTLELIFKEPTSAYSIAELFKEFMPDAESYRLGGGSDEAVLSREEHEFLVIRYMNRAMIRPLLGDITIGYETEELLKSFCREVMKLEPKENIVTYGREKSNK